MPCQYELEVFKSLLSLFVAALTLSATWFVGYNISAHWNLHQKRNELNLAALGAFHSLYGEFKELVKTWRLAKKTLEHPVIVPEGERWRLLVRACSLESKCEALVLRLTTEPRIIDEEQLNNVGLFRQAIQSLRESIRDDVDCPLGSRHEEYELLNKLAPVIAQLASSEVSDKPLPLKTAQDQLNKVVNVRSSDWKAKVESMKPKEKRKDIPPSNESDEDA